MRNVDGNTLTQAVPGAMAGRHERDARHLHPGGYCALTDGGVLDPAGGAA